MTVTLLVMALNEIDGIQVVLPKVDRNGVDQILVVDGGSTDGTVEWARENGYEVHEQRHPGIRYGYIEALPLIKGDVIISFSPDGNSPPEDVPRLIEKMKEGYDLVIGSRYLGDAYSEDDDFLTAFGNWYFTKSINLLHGAPYTDAMVMYRAFRKQLIYDLELDRDDCYRLPEKLFFTMISWEPLMSVRAAKAGAKIGGIPVNEPPRIGGERKLQIVRWGLAYTFQVWRELVYWRRPRAARALKFGLGVIAVAGILKSFDIL